MTHADYIASALRVFETEAAAVAGLGCQLNGHYCSAIEKMLESRGRVVVCGMGKSGIVGRKISATLSSTGTPSFFMHPAEAYHGDLGMVTPDDVFIAVSNSGETSEVLKLLPYLRDNGNFVISMTGNVDSSLARASDCHINIGVEREACPLALAPTSSTTAAIAMGDAIAVTLMEARGFTPESFARFHPGGSLGKRLLNRVEHEMVTEQLPFASPSDRVTDILDVMTRGGLGVALVRAPDGWGLVTDGDIRRGIRQYGDAIFEIRADRLMSRNPISVGVGTRVEDALNLMDQRKITSLLVMDKAEVVGIFKK